MTTNGDGPEALNGAPEPALTEVELLRKVQDEDAAWFRELASSAPQLPDRDRRAS